MRRFEGGREHRGHLRGVGGGDVGAQLGFRRLDMGYIFEDDRGDFGAKGLYFGGVVRY